MTIDSYQTLVMDTEASAISRSEHKFFESPRGKARYLKVDSLATKNDLELLMEIDQGSEHSWFQPPLNARQTNRPSATIRDFVCIVRRGQQLCTLRHIKN